MIGAGVAGPSAISLPTVSPDLGHSEKSRTWRVPGEHQARFRSTGRPAQRRGTHLLPTRTPCGCDCTFRSSPSAAARAAVAQLGSPLSDRPALDRRMGGHIHLAPRMAQLWHHQSITWISKSVSPPYSPTRMAGRLRGSHAPPATVVASRPGPAGSRRTSRSRPNDCTGRRSHRRDSHRLGTGHWCALRKRGGSAGSRRNGRFSTAPSAPNTKTCYDTGSSIL